MTAQPRPQRDKTGTRPRTVYTGGLKQQCVHKRRLAATYRYKSPSLGSNLFSMFVSPSALPQAVILKKELLVLFMS